MCSWILWPSCRVLPALSQQKISSCLCSFLLLTPTSLYFLFSLFSVLRLMFRFHLRSYFFYLFDPLLVLDSVRFLFVTHSGVVLLPSSFLLNLVLYGTLRFVLFVISFTSPCLVLLLLISCTCVTFVQLLLVLTFIIFIYLVYYAMCSF
jgi:hypothetical protein